VRLDRVHRFNYGLYTLLSRRVLDIRVHPDLKRLGVPISCVLGVPWIGRRYLFRHLRERAHCVQRLDQRSRVASVWDVTIVNGTDAVQIVDVFHSCTGSREPLYAHLIGECHHVVLTWTHPLRSDVDHLTVTDWMVQDTPADPVSRLEHDRGNVSLHEFARSRQPGESGADHDYVNG